MVTGSSGQLGRALLNELEESIISFVGFNSRELDITNNVSVEQVFSSIKPKLVINAAAWTDVEGAEENVNQAFNVNQLGVRNLALASNKWGSKLIHLSTDYVFSGDASKPWSEYSPLDPQTVYGKSKAAGESEIKEIIPHNSLIVRTAWLYSHYGKNFAKTIAKIGLNSQREIQVVNDQIGQPTCANELATQIVSLAQTNTNEQVFHGTNSGQATWFDFALEIFEFIGADKRRLIPVTTNNYPSSVRRPLYSVLGHEAWTSAGIKPMQNWRTALKCALPKILSSVEKGT
jgi:dTDP-4-dehydrorhamnose reductase